MKTSKNKKKDLQVRRQKRIRAKISGSATRPRLAVFRSLKHLSVQAIDDARGLTLAAVTDVEVKAESRMEKAKLIGEMIAKKLQDKSIKQAVFDKRHYRYHGLVKAIADGARAAGLEF